MDLTVLGVCIEKLRKSTSPAVLVVGKGKSVPLEIAPEKKASNYAIIVLHFPAIRFCKVINA